MRTTLQGALSMAVLAATAAIAAISAGCASKQPISAVDWDHGARRGWIVARYTPDAIGATLPPCLANLRADDYVAHRFVKVRYRQGKHSHDAVAELPAGVPLVDGEQVELWPADCAAGQLAHISRVLPVTAAVGD
ncbi:hypothetical protein GTP46_26025 [Duganella sp. FT135W]|uniref:Lipoprotein n=1 Tax=Duganella flavida TaxID=2692175 RepID=A0A6L8KF63_9BURK|nr:hypothetical protein [Duganella flavida]MYM26093.1 hypothetical protein [Duganella flavida]